MPEFLCIYMSKGLSLTHVNSITISICKLLTFYVIHCTSTKKLKKTKFRPSNIMTLTSFQKSFVTIMCRYDELSSTIS